MWRSEKVLPGCDPGATLLRGMFSILHPATSVNALPRLVGGGWEYQRMHGVDGGLVAICPVTKTGNVIPAATRLNLRDSLGCRQFQARKVPSALFSTKVSTIPVETL